MSANISVPEDLYDKATAIAAAQKVSVDEVLATAFSEQLALWERLNARAQQGSREKFLAVLDRVPDVEPEEFDRFRRDGTSFAVTVRLGAPFVGEKPKQPAQPEYRCAVQISGIGDDRVIAPWGEDPFVALQYAIDFVGEKLDDFARARESPSPI